MKPLSFKVISDHFLLCVFLSLLWGVTDITTTRTPSTTLTTVTSTTQAVTTETTTAASTTPAIKSPPGNVENVTVSSQNETSITLVWNKVDNLLTYFLQYNNSGSLKVDTVVAQEEGLSVIHVVDSLTPGTKYDFRLITESDGGNSTGYSFEAVTAPLNAMGFKSVGESETSITLQWEKVNNFLNYRLVFNGQEINVTASAGHQVTHTVPGLTSMTRYVFTLFTLFGNVKSHGVTTPAFTAPPNAEDFKSVGENETSITLQWKQVDGIINYTLVYNEKETDVPASAGQDLITYTIPGLTNGTKYVFTLFTVFHGIRSSGENTTALTIPLDAMGFKSVGESETSITLQWEKVNDFLNYRLVFDGEEINVTASAGHQVTHTVPGLTSMTRYVFTLFTLFGNVKSRGVTTPAFTAPRNTEKFDTVEQNETSITLQWQKVDGLLNYTLVFNEKEISVTASVGNEVTHTVSGLTSMTRYVFTLFTLFENVRSSGVNTTAFTAPRNTEAIESAGQNETSITLQWKEVNGVTNYILVLDKREIDVSALMGQEKVIHTISGLTSGTKYNFTLYSLFGNVRSSGLNYSAATAPCNTEEVESVGQNETSITLQWKKVNEILNYTLVFNERVINLTALKEIENVTHTISELTSGTKYNFCLYTVFENVRSSGVKHSAVTAPVNVKTVTVLTQNESSVTLMWDKVNNISTYFLQYDNNGSYIEVNQGASVTHEVSSLNAGTNYHFTVITRFEKVNSTGFSFNAVTVPSMVALVEVTERSATTITLTWQRVKTDWDYFLLIKGGNTQRLPDRAPDVVSRSVTSLKPGTKYFFSVITTFSGHNSTAYSNYTVTMIDCATVNWHVTNSSIQGTVKGLFSKATATYQSQIHTSHGGSNVTFTGLYPGATYEVSLEYENDSRRYPQCNHNLTIIPPLLSGHCEYWAAGYSLYIVWDNPKGVWTSVEVNVMGQSHTQLANGEQYLILSGFQPARKYEVSITSISGTVRSYKPYVFQCLTDPRGVIAGSVFAVLLFVILVCVAVFIFLKRPDIIRKKSFIGGSKQTNKKSKAISVAKFPDHFTQLSADENRGFTQEYESLSPVGTEQTRKVASLLENKTRNRFNNVQPYDWCRVKLTTSSSIGASDYINASYMPGYNNSREYIASQGPLPTTVNDFWRMVWEQRVNCIVMVTNCTEGGKIKCERYWPADTQPCSYGELEVTLTSEQQEINWTLREFSVKHSNNSEERIVKHFHFTAWPDHGVPQGTEDLIQFRGLVRLHIEREGTRAPTVVHCSAGVGRTGTIIALDVLLQQLEKERAVGINGFVHKMRLNRPYMVQTESQYVFLHQCIMDSLQPHETADENIYENADMIYANATALRDLR
ncbi:receptor-type tyrosine-protein phosphatase H-like isoform X2 [Plectropomus leopardus]|uniref:receptor-type tyrosine-protein phosphatase H-like isoform X2 n=1 Tax=Plectropomus leopardus TaxID=160734 RepID=UPI001C4B85EE|nr:receptor-type tyrosine-protein phosphatase H-like isoform X2 [Plectropomus leopardus]